MAASDNPPGVLMTAIVAKYLASGSLSAIKGPYQNRKPVDKAADQNPYCVYRIIESFDDGWTCLGRRWLCVVHFSFIAGTPEAANANLNTFNAVFSSESLSLTFPTGCGLISHRQVHGNFDEEEQPNMHQAACRYKFRFQLPRVP